MGLTDAGATLLTGGITATLSIVDSLIRSGRAEKARDIIANMDIPPATKFYLDSKLMEAARVGDPDIFTAVVQGPSALENISEDPRLRSGQLREIAGYEDIIDSGSSPEMDADLLRTQTALGTAMRGSREAGLQQLASRGMLGSGMEGAMRTGIQQQGIGSASQAGADLAAQNRATRMQALGSLGGAAGRMRGQEWGQKAQVATSKDVIDAANKRAQDKAGQFNIANKMATSQFNAQQAMKEAQARAEAERARAEMEMQRQIAMAQTYQS